eukprot:TRINITY_DN2583_c0_g1_i2.p1 TRINITY_DN2583_c0_g1~~TRINITY_DN2583_c0_g1_i2.p1  ORF type:complete len:634 (+),score=203.39 TRINITY_DN2583_c0_g1_i2:123-2024(+)
MPYVIFVASDVFGQKVNLELEMPFAPSIPELTGAIERAFTAEQQSRRPGAPPFQVAKIHVVDEVTDDWVELTAPHQLRNYCQAYAFQPHSTRYTEQQGHIPPATKAKTNAAPGYASAARGGSAGLRGAGVSPVPGRGTSPCGGAGTYGGAAATYSGTYQSSASAHVATHVHTQQVTSGSALPPPVQPRRVLSEDASHDDKVRVLFEELDSNRNRTLESDELRRGFRITGLDFTAATNDDLFRKADCDRDGVISFPEWQRFGELYPTLMDSLYYRLKAHYEHAAQEQTCLEARGSRSVLEEQERRAKAAYDQAQLDAEDAGRRLADSDRAVADAAARGRAAEDSVREAVRGVDRARQLRAERERELASERERERQAQIRAQDSARELDTSQRGLAAVQQALAEAEAREQRILQELADAQREIARQRQAADLAAGDVSRAQERHNQLLREMPRGVEDAAAALAHADQELAAADAQHRELASRAADAGASVNDIARARDDAARLMQQLRDSQEPARLCWLDAQRELEEHDRRVAEMEAELAAEADRRRATDDQEKALVEQEIRLREQRETLEEREQTLREAHCTFFSSSKKGNPGAGGSPLPPGAAGGVTTHTHAVASSSVSASHARHFQSASHGY